jgi:hypothetical protein
MQRAAPERAPLRVGRSVWVGALLVGAGIAFRFWLAFGPLGHPSSDESVVGLMALELLRHGHLHAFYWGQSYGGSLEAVLVAPWLWLFGANTLALKLTTFLAGLAGAGLTWRIGRHLFRPVVASWVGVISLFWPATLVWYGTKEGGFYPLTAALGLFVVLMALNIDEQPGRARYWAGLGIATGIGWWMSPNIAYYALPMAAWLVARGHWRRSRKVVVAVAGLLGGSAIWISANVLSGFDSLHAPSAWAGSSTYLSRFKFFWRSGLPFSLGLRRPWGEEWYGGRYLGSLLYVAALAALVFGFSRLFRFRVRDLLLPDLFLIAAAPFVYATFVGNWHLFEGRYTYFVGSMMPILLGRVLQARLGAAVVLVLVIVPGVAFMRDYDHNRATIGPSTAPIARALERAGVRTAVARYAIAYQLTFESDERVIAVPATDDRYPPFRAQVRRSSPAYVFYSADPAAARSLTDALTARHIGFRVINAGRYVAVLPGTRYVSPALAGAG